jgi:hypothetical protein
MELKPPHWEEPASGIRLLRLYTTDLKPDWPRVVILELTADRFREFENDPLGFDKTYKLYPEQPMRWISSCAKPPQVEEIPSSADALWWTVVTIHSRPSAVVSAACPHLLV